jgi:membrane protease YdiL (CAAX protease family)
VAAKPATHAHALSSPLACAKMDYPGTPLGKDKIKRWLAVVVSAASAGICEETGFRGYMQRPIEQRHGAPVAILISSFFFMALHRLASEDGYAELPPPLLAKIKTKVSSLH